MAHRSFYVIPVVAIVVLLLAFTLGRARAETQINLTVRVGSSNIIFNGKGAPLSVVTFVQNGSTIGTTTTDADGNFSKSFSGFDSDIQYISMYETDPNFLTTPTINYSIATQPGLDETINNIVLPPTIRIDLAETTYGDSASVSGATVPNANVTVFINGTIFGAIPSGSDGTWSLAIDTKSIPGYLATNTINAITEYQTYNSETSRAVYLKINNPLPSPTPTPTPHHDEEETVPDNPTPTPTTAEALTAEQIAQEAPTPTPYINPLVKLFPHLDRNGDHKIEITEVYEVVKTWVTGWRAGETKDCDINNDGVCNLIDLSITLYYINR